MTAATSANPIVDFIESDTEYTESMSWQAVTFDLIGIRGDFDTDIFATFDQQHEIVGCPDDYLCTGDGFRWTPEVPALRFR